jgi:pantetheine-phosphate adenylyltransferase
MTQPRPPQGPSGRRQTTAGGQPAKPSRASQRIAVYPGSFDPIHLGHLDLIERCRGLFDVLYVAVLSNEEKRSLFTVDERLGMIRDMVKDYPECRVESFSGLLVDFMDKVGARIVVRGLRAVSDFDYEFQMALMNRKLNSRVETVFMVPKDDLTYVSSRLLKEVCSLGGDLSSFLPDIIWKRLQQRLAPPTESERA